MKEKIAFVWRLLTSPGTRFYYNSVHGKYRDMPDEEYIPKMYKARLGRTLNLQNPKRFSEKLQWLKLHNRDDLYSKLVDKYEVKEYVAGVIGEQYVIPTINIWDDVEHVDISSLPDKFVLKCTHDSGGIYICNDKNTFDFESAKSGIADRLTRNFYWGDREWPYKEVKPRVLAEEYRCDSETGELRDYKLFCFNGKVKFYKIDFGRFTEHHANYYDLDGNLMDFTEVEYPPDRDIKVLKPDFMPKMIELAEKLADNMPFVRVDFYYADGQIYFGEMTFYPTGGFNRFVPDKWDEVLGDMINLPE